MEQVEKAIPIVFVSDSRRFVPVSVEADVVPAPLLNQDDEAGIDEVILFLTTESIGA